MAFQTDGSPDTNDEPALQPDINVTPFIDVMLVLLIIFMVTAPMLASGMKVELPRSSRASPVDPAPPVIVTVGPLGEIQVGERMVSAEDLVSAVRATLGSDERPIQVRGDSKAAYGNVVAVLDALSAGGLPKFVLIFERRSTTSEYRAKPGERLIP